MNVEKKLSDGEPYFLVSHLWQLYDLYRETEDIQKARQYLNKVIEVHENNYDPEYGQGLLHDYKEMLELLSEQNDSEEIERIKKRISDIETEIEATQES